MYVCMYVYMHIYINMLHTYTDEQIIYEYKCIYIHINTYIDIYIYKYMYTQTRGGDGGMHAAQHATHVSGCCDSDHRTCNLHVRVTVGVTVCCSVLRFGAVYCSVLQCVAVWCSVLQRVAVCCNTLYYTSYTIIVLATRRVFEWVSVCVCVCVCVRVCLWVPGCFGNCAMSHVNYIAFAEGTSYLLHMSIWAYYIYYAFAENMFFANVWNMWHALYKCMMNVICSLQMQDTYDMFFANVEQIWHVPCKCMINMMCSLQM